MAYRGEDLDLRTPQGWGAAGRDTSSGAEGQPNWWTRTSIYKGGRADPIWVDDTVMSCCNHAFDLALAHRAPEVRLEHLLNAMTLNEPASKVLESRGIGVSSLRRDSGAIIASEIPNGAINGLGSPKRSEALEETLRLAADRAYPRRTPVTVDDLLHVLFDMKRDLPGLQLLHRHAAPWAGRNGSEPHPDIRLEPLPHLAPRPAYSEPRYTAPEERPRYASQAAHDYFTQPAPRETVTVREPSRERELRPSREPATTFVDTQQNMRIEAIERTLRELGSDLASERKSIKSLVSDIQRHSAAQADDTIRFRGALTERLNSLDDSLLRARTDAGGMPSTLLDRIDTIERNLDARLSEVGRGSGLPTAILDRMAAIERNLDARLAEVGRGAAIPAALIDRIVALERNLDARLAEIGRVAAAPSALLDRMAAVERSIEARLSELKSAPGLPTALTDRVAAIERNLDTRLAELGRIWSGIGERLQALEASARRPTEVALPAVVSQRLESVGALGTRLDEIDRTFQVILDRMTALERHQTVDMAPVEARIAQAERTVVASLEKGTDLAPIATLLSTIEGRVATLERSIDNRAAETGRTVSFIGERLRAFEEALGGQRTQSGERLAQLERALSAFGERAVETTTAHRRDLTEVHDALVKLNTNQQTLAGTLDSWRLDNTGDLSVINNRLRTIEETSVRRDPLVESLAAQVAAIHGVVAKREHHKSRFRNWLFGTDEWYSASYDTESWRARQAAEIARDLDVRPVPRPVPPIPPTAPPIRRA